MAMAETHMLAQKENFESYLKTFDQVQLFYYTLGVSLVAYFVIFHGIGLLQSVLHQIWLEHGLFKYIATRVFGVAMHLPMVKNQI